MSSVIGGAVDSAGNDVVAREFNERTRLLYGGNEENSSDSDGRPQFYTHTHTGSSSSTSKNNTAVTERETDPAIDSGSDDEHSDVDPDEAHSRLNEEYRGLPWTHRPSSIVLVIIFSLFAIGQSMVTASNLDVMFELICRSLYDAAPSRSLQIPIDAQEPPEFGADPRCRGPEVAALVANFTSYRTAILGILGIVATPKLASYSDRIGRKYIILWCSFCGMFADIIPFLCTSYPQYFDYRWLLVSSAIQGIGGSLMTVQVLNSSYVADCIPPSLRAKSLAMLDSCLFGSIAIGPVIGSLILSTYRSLPKLYMVSIGFYVTNIVLTALFLVESRPLKARRMSQVQYDTDLEQVMSNATNWQQYLHKVNFLKPLALLKFDHLSDRASRRNARMLVIMASLGMEFAIAISPIIMMIAELKFKWTGVEVGYLISVFGMSRVFVLAIIFPLALRFLRSKFRVVGNGLDKVDLTMIRIGQLISIFGYSALGNAPNPKVFAIVLIIDSLAGVQIPSMKNAIIKHAPQDRIGELLGALSLVNNFSMVVGPLVFFRIFNLTVATRPQTVFEIVSLGFFCLLITSFFLSKPSPPPSPDEPHNYGSTEQPTADL
ncbi:hypothetical protein AWJ20_5206 [Sugiyamaella lignohabitans]|uniref:Major facilitator superfamily (MFS) profile domain-containing protein n=1 Tax=Sugiyamaella lignohabitans TaxID=796027 RepID=A0A167EM98_9ASCO|nr:uncharacterized protein AWJ20_5206 [Sugiyamaella lignohabitans]ANB14245.1 hypothetical protein AWJ20_5206 [Sugiyamaella lignohabitans]